MMLSALRLGDNILRVSFIKQLIIKPERVLQLSEAEEIPLKAASREKCKKWLVIGNNCVKNKQVINSNSGNKSI